MNAPARTAALLLSLSLFALGPVWSDSETFLDAGADRLHYMDAGNGYPLVVIGGGSGMSSAQWQLVADRLIADFRIIAFDPRGIGRSDNPTAPYSETEDLALLLNHLDIERTIVIGLSSSGGLALEFALAYPDRTAGVVVSAPFVPGFAFSPSMQERVQRFAAAAEQGREPFLDAMFGDPHFIPAPRDRSVRQTARRWMGEQFDKTADFDATLPRVPGIPLMQRVDALRVPLLLLAGDLDHPDVLQRNRIVAGKVAGARLSRIEDAGHNPHLENPDAFVTTIGPFLAEAASSSGSVMPERRSRQQ